MRKGLVLKSRGSEAGLPELERIVTTAAARRMEPKLNSWRRLSGAKGSRVVAVGLCALAFGGTAMATTGAWDPLVGSSEHPAPLSDTPVPAGLVAELGVLRREQTAKDRSAEVEATLEGGPIGFKYMPSFAVRLDSVRYLGPGPNHEALILLSGVRTERPAIEPKRERWTAEVGEVCVARPIPGFEEAPMECFDRIDLMSGQAVLGRAGLAPDGVATVTAKFYDAPDVTVPVKDNYWKLPPGAHRSPSRPQFVWRDADGNFIPHQDPYIPWWVKRGREEAKTGRPYRPEHP